MPMRLPLVILLAALSWLLLALPPVVLIMAGIIHGDLAAASIWFFELSAKTVALIGVGYVLAAIAHLARGFVSSTDKEAMDRMRSAVVLSGYAAVLIMAGMLLHSILTLTRFEV